MRTYKLLKFQENMPTDWELGMQLSQGGRGKTGVYTPVNKTYSDYYLKYDLVENTPDVFELQESESPCNDILKLRYLVLTPWPPSSHFAKDSIVTPDQFTGWHPKDFPVIFREMPWYEARELRDMPTYLKSPAGNSVRHVKHYELHWDKVVFVGGAIRPLKQWLPATEQEYIAFTQKTEQL